MSAGKFEDGRYQANSTIVYPCRVQPETKGLTLGGTANAYPSDPVGAGQPSIRISSGRRQFGVIPRTVTVEMTGDPTGEVADYEGIGTTHTIPVFSATSWNSYTKGQTGTYLGVPVRFVSKSPEIIR